MQQPAAPAQRRATDTSSAAQPAADNHNAQLIDRLDTNLVHLILRYVGAHQLESTWDCSYCNPYWWGWYCHTCQMTNTILYWTPTRHFGHCGQNCPCCRTELADWGGCEGCWDLHILHATSHGLRSLLQTYNGR